MTQAEEEFLQYYVEQTYHCFRDLEEYARISAKIKAEADRRLTF